VDCDLQQLIADANAALLDINWSQVGMNPIRHSTFYERESEAPCFYADEVIIVGPLVLAKNLGVGTRLEHMMY
jgi:hypothetical protein